MDEATRIQAALGILGMGPREARAYEHLGSTGAQDAAAVAVGIGVSRGQAYRVLGELLRRGHVVLAATEPVTYRPVDPAEQAEIARIAERQRGAALERSRVAFLAALAPAQAPRPAALRPWKVRRVIGRHAFHAAARRLILKARSSLLISYAACATEVEERARRALIEVAKRREAQGVELRIVARAPRASSSARSVEAPIFFVVDGRECLFLSLKPGPHGIGAEGCWTSVGPLVAVAASLHQELWHAVDP